MIEKLPKVRTIPTPPLFIEEMAAKLTEEFCHHIQELPPPSGYSLYKQREN